MLKVHATTCKMNVVYIVISSILPYTKQHIHMYVACTIFAINTIYKNKCYSTKTVFRIIKLLETGLIIKTKTFVQNLRQPYFLEVFIMYAS